MFKNINEKPLRIYLAILLSTALVVNEYSMQWMVAIFVGGHGILDGFMDAFKHWTLAGYFFLTGFRLIPYAILAATVKALSKRRKDLVDPVFWGGLVGILFLYVWGSWETLRPLYTEEHASSTSALIYLVLPVYEVFTGIVGAALGIFVYSLAGREFHKTET